MSASTDRWLLIDEAAAYVGCCTKTLRRAIENKTLRGFKRAGRWRFERIDLDRWVRGETVGRPSGKSQAPAATMKEDGYLKSVYRELTGGSE